LSPDEEIEEEEPASPVEKKKSSKKSTKKEKKGADGPTEWSDATFKKVKRGKMYHRRSLLHNSRNCNAR